MPFISAFTEKFTEIVAFAELLKTTSVDRQNILTNPYLHLAI